MKFTCAYYLLLLYMTVMLKPLLPVVTDTYDHAFNEISHIAKVHARFGANHLSAELADINKSDNGKAGNLVKTISEIPVHIPTVEINNLLPVNQETIHDNPFLSQYLQAISLSVKGPPPRFYC